MPIPVKVRTYRPDDLAACRQLYREGLIGGKLAENDTGVDIDDIETAYLQGDRGHFWVAQTDSGEVVGMIGVQHRNGEAEIRRLRVRQDLRRRGIGARLLESAIQWCKERGMLKVTLD